MPPRVNNEGQYSDKGTVDHDGKLVPYTAEEIARTRAYETEHKIPSTLPAEEAEAVEALADESEDDSAE